MAIISEISPPPIEGRLRGTQDEMDSIVNTSEKFRIFSISSFSHFTNRWIRSTVMTNQKFLV
jgi:hypothetical protein